MRLWISLLLLGVGLTVGFAGPVAANTTTPRSPVVVVQNGHAHGPFHRHHFRGHPGLGPFVFGTPLVSPDAYYGSGIASSALPFMTLFGYCVRNASRALTFPFGSCCWTALT